MDPYKDGRRDRNILHYSKAEPVLGFSPVHSKYNTTRNSKIKPYAEKIKQMLKKGTNFRQIRESIKKDGYDGASSTIHIYTIRERKLMKEAKGASGETVEKIKRKWLISLLYKL